MFNKTVVFSASALALVLGAYLSLYGLNLPGGNSPLQASDIEGFMWPEQKQLEAFGMVDNTNSPFDLANLGNHWNFLFFGYISCPDICPATLSVMRETRQLLDENTDNRGTDTRFIFVSVDGERDTPTLLADYIRFYDESFVALTGSRTQLDSLTTQLGVPYVIEPHQAGVTDYQVGHSGAILLISPNGKLVTIFQMPHQAQVISQRYLTIRNFMEQNS